MSTQLSDLESTRAAITNHIVRDWSYAQQGDGSWAYLHGLLTGFYVAGQWEGEAGTDLLVLANIAHDYAVEVQK